MSRSYEQLARTEFCRLALPLTWRSYLTELIGNYRSGAEGLDDDPIVDPWLELLEVLRSLGSDDSWQLRVTMVSRALARSDSLYIRGRCGARWWNPLEQSLRAFRASHEKCPFRHYRASGERHPVADVAEYRIQCELRERLDTLKSFDILPTVNDGDSH